MPATAAPVDEVRARVMAGLAAAVAEKGYAQATLNDIVRCAQISKSTFYAHFRDKEDCFLAAYRDASDALLRHVVDAAQGHGTPEERSLRSTRAYLEALAADPDGTRTFMVEVLAAGPAALAARQEVNRRYAESLRVLWDEGGVARLTPAQALLVSGGFSELVIDAVVAGRVERLPELTDEVVRLVLAAARGAEG